MPGPRVEGKRAVTGNLRAAYMRPQTVKKRLYGRALLARTHLPCKKTVPENALLR